MHRGVEGKPMGRRFSPDSLQKDWEAIDVTIFCDWSVQQLERPGTVGGWGEAGVDP
jgi:hypothetical protein